MTRQELINAVKTKVDELSAPDGRVMPVGMLYDKPVDSFADGLLDECGREVLLNAPAWRLQGATAGVSARGNKDGSGYVVLPDDFLRLLEFKMPEWESAVTEVSAAGSGAQRRQGIPFLRGGCCKPVCVIGHRPEGRVLEYYSVKKKHEAERFVYVKEVPAEDVQVDLQDVLTWWCAGRILAITGKVNESQMAYESGRRLL